MRLIDADAAKKLAQKYLIDPYYVSACAVIDKAETVDAMPVVCCRECKHFGHLIGDGKHACNKYQLPYCKENDFCSYGDPKK